MRYLSKDVVSTLWHMERCYKEKGKENISISNENENITTFLELKK